MSNDRLLDALILSKPVEKIRKEFNESRHKFSKAKIKDIRRNLYEIRNKKHLFALRMKEIEKSLDELEKNLSKTKQYYDHDDIEYKGIKDIKDLHDFSIGGDYYKPIITKSSFNNNYIQYESRGGKDKILTVNEYLDIIRPYLREMINDHKTQSEWKIQLTAAISFISSKSDSNETRFMHAKSDNIEIMMGSETREIIKKIFESLLKKCQKGLEESMRGSEFIFDGADALYYDLNKISLSRGKSYIDSPKWLKNKKATINPKNNNGKCFRYALAVALNYQNIKNNPERISKIKLFIDHYNWKEIDFPSHKKDCKKFKSINKSIALNILYVPHNTKEIRHAYKSKYNLKREKHVIILMITDGEKCHYLAVKSLSALFRGITSKYEGDFHCLNCFRSYTTKNKLKKHENVCENHHYCYIEIPEEDNKILKYNHGEKSIRAPFVIYVDLEFLLEKMSTCHNNPKKS